MYVDEKNRADQLQIEVKRLTVEVEGLKKEWQDVRWGYKLPWVPIQKPGIGINPSIASAVHICHA
jgi:hypothetical protein